MVLPPVVLLFAQIGFLPYQGVTITWCQRIVIAADVVLLAYFWPLITAPALSRWIWWRSALPITWIDRIDVTGRPLDGWKRLRLQSTRRGGLRLIGFGISCLMLSFVVITIPDEPWELALTRAIAWLQPHVVERSNTSTTVYCAFIPVAFEHGYDQSVPAVGELPNDAIKISVPDKLVFLCPTALMFHSNVAAFARFRRTLSLAEQTLHANTPLPELLDQLEGGDRNAAAEALKKVEGLKMQGRRLRYADFARSRLQRADLRGVDLGGARLDHAQLAGALQDDAKLQGASLFGAQLQGASLRRSQLQGATLAFARLSGASLEWAALERADLRNAQLQAAKLYSIRLQGADLSRARLEGASIARGELQFANLTLADLRAVTLVRADLQGARLSSANLQGAVLYQTDLRGADLNGISYRDLNVDPIADDQSGYTSWDALRLMDFDSARQNGPELV